MNLLPRWRYKLDRWRSSLASAFHSEPSPKRPRLCPTCGTLVGASSRRCHECGASMNFSLAAASKSLSGMLPSQSPATYGILTLSCLLYGVSLLVTIRQAGGMQPPSGGGFGMLFGIGAIDGRVLVRLGSSLPLPYDILQPWRLVTAIFLHGFLLHIAFNMMVLLDVGPMVEELYGSARYFFLYVATGISGYVLSAFLLHRSVGGSGAVLGMVGVLLATTTGRRSAGVQMLRSQLVRLLVYVAVMGFLFRGTDNAAHLGGLAAGYVLGRLMPDRQPVSKGERQRAQALGWLTGLVVVASLAFMLAFYFQTASQPGG